MGKMKFETIEHERDKDAPSHQNQYSTLLDQSVQTKS